MARCEHCEGEGRMLRPARGGNDPDSVDIGECPECHGKGSVRDPYNLHILDYLSWQLHPGWTITQATNNFALAYTVAMSIAKPRHLSNPTTL